jgi:hypothetical protein
MGENLTAVVWPAADVVKWACLAGSFGLLVGATELLGRYRDEPLRALVRLYGVMYMGFNAAVSVGMFVLIYTKHESALPTLSPLDGALLSGFGAMALLRSKFLTFRTKSDEEIPIGLDVVVRKLLDVADRGVDRSQSHDRWKAIFDNLKIITDPSAFEDLVAFLRTVLKGYQGVSSDELTTFDMTITELKSDVAHNVTFRAMTAGLAFQQIAGTQNFVKAIKQFKTWKQGGAQAALQP